MSDSSGTESLAEGSLISHLLELRDRLLRAVIVVLVIFAPCAYFSQELFTLIAHPLLAKLPNGSSMVSTSLTAPVMAPLKLAVLVALFIGIPYVLYQIWAFVAPACTSAKNALSCPCCSPALCCSTAARLLLTSSYFP